MPNQKPWFFEDPDLDQVRARYGAWTDMIARRSMEAIYALGAANWVLLSSDKAAHLCQSKWLAFSIILCFSFIAMNLVFAWFIKEILLRRLLKSEGDRYWWKQQSSTDIHFPEGSKIYYISWWLHNLRILIPILAFIFFSMGAWPYLSNLISFIPATTHCEPNTTQTTNSTEPKDEEGSEKSHQKSSQKIDKESQQKGSKESQ